MFGIGSWELGVIVLVVLVVFGPQRLPELARVVGDAMRMFRKASDELRRNLDMSDMPNPRDFRVDLDDLEPRYEREYKKRFSQRRTSESAWEDVPEDEEDSEMPESPAEESAENASAAPPTETAEPPGEAPSPEERPL